jgi:hypothetical protein
MEIAIVPQMVRISEEKKIATVIGVNPGKSCEMLLKRDNRPCELLWMVCGETGAANHEN